MRACLPALAIGLALTPLAHVTAQDDLAHRQKIEEIRKLISLSGGEQSARQVLEQMTARMRQTGAPTRQKGWKTSTS